MGYENSRRFSGLERILRRYFNNENLKVVYFTTTDLLPPGENYSSIVVKLDVTIRRCNNDKDEEIHLVAKTSIPCEKPIINWPHAFKKELFVYAELLPTYRDIEREAGVSNKDLISVLPDFVGYTSSLQDNGFEIDEDSTLLMENLKSKGYHTLDKRIGLDVEHASKALECLARYHALGIVTMQKRPSFAAIAMKHARISPYHPDAAGKAIDPIRKTFQSCSHLSNYLDVLESSLENMKKLKYTRTLLPKEPWLTITHGDFHTNNVMFHEDEHGNVDDVKLVDFQVYFYASSLIELPYFFCGSLDESALADHFDHLLDVYYDNLLKTLKRLNVDTAAFSKNAFDAELKKQAAIVFAPIAILIMFLHFQVEKDDQVSKGLHTNVFQSGASNVLRNKLIELVNIYEKRNWFCQN